MSFRFPQPSNEDDFELLCLRFLRELWKCPTLNRYGKRGERQHGIDLIDEAGVAPLRAVQSKHHEPDKTIPPAEITAEVNKALGAGLPIDEYYILTTARKTVQGQTAVIRINREHAADNRFKVFLWTWEEIETVLSEMDDVAQERVLRGDTGRSGPAVTRMMAAVLTEHFDRPMYGSGNSLDKELESIQHALERHEFEVAEARLRELETRAADKLQPHHWYQLKALRSRVFSSRWQWDQAGRELLDAKRFMPDTERARVNEALGHELVGERTKAHALATDLRREFPHNVRLLTVWVRTAPSDAPLASLVEAAGAAAKDDEELSLALAYRALSENRFAEALAFGQRAAELDSDSPHASLVLGQTKHTEGYAGAAGIQTAYLREAAQHYDRAIQLSHDQKLPGLEAATRFERGKVRHLLGDSRAESDYAIAIELARPEQGLRTSYASYLVELGRYNDALRELALETGEPTSARMFFEAAARHERNAGDDRQQAVALLHCVVAAGPSERWDEAHILLVQWAVESKSLTDARRVIEDSTLREANPLVYHTLNGWIASADGEGDTAKAAFGAALEAVSKASSRDQVYLLAQALVSVGDDERALPLLLRCYRPGAFNVECRKLLDCARRLNRHDVSVRVCRELREAGETDPRIILTEISVLQMYDPQQALRIAQEYLAAHPNDRHVALWQSTLALRLDHPELVISDLGRLPAPHDVTPQGSGLVINVLAAVNRPAEALHYAYQALRAHFDEEFAHGQYIAHFLRLSPQCRELGIAGTAAPGMAICYREEHADVDQWVVVEDEAEPDLALDDVGRDHPLSRALAGKKVGDVVTLPGNEVQPRTATIRDIVHKCVYRFRDCIARFQERFPGATACQPVHVGSGDEFDPTPIIRKLEDRHRQIEMLDGLYRTRPMPFHVYAELAGVNEPEAWLHLVATLELGIRCFNGQGEELRAGLELVNQAKTIIVDLTAILTLTQLGLLRVLGTAKRTTIVAQNTFDRLQHLVEEARDDGTAGGSFLLADDGGLARTETTPEQRESNRKFLAGMRDAVRERCRILPCLRSADLEPQRRERLIQVVGRHNLDSMLLASEPDAMLWTDDLILGIIGRADFQSPRVWTQVVLFVLQQGGTISRQEYDQAIAKLVGWHYHGIVWNADTLLAAAQIAGWQMHRWPAPQVTRGLGNRDANAVERIRIAAEAIRGAWQLDISPFARQGFLFAVLAGLGSLQLVRRLREFVPAFFSVDVLSALEVVQTISVWLQFPTGGIAQP
jgi:predicted Zn-dependent protease